jgi:hypothetical protein
MINIKKLQERIDELEKQVRDLQARPVYIPVFPPSNPYILPYVPPITIPWSPLQPTYTSSQSGQNTIKDIQVCNSVKAFN